MQDITISSKRIRQEGINLLICFSLSILINTIAIFWYETNWSELFTSLPYVVIFGFSIYGISSGIRLVYYFLKTYFESKKKNRLNPN